jgi:amidophosphoribosyltransferase
LGFGPFPHTHDRVFGLRDPLGIKPLCLGKLDNGHVIASETVALDVLGAEIVRDVRPGELIELTDEGYNSYQLMEEKHRAHCFFEYVYFSRADSVIDERDVYLTRKRIGEQLAREYPADADLVVPVPDSGRAHAYGYSGESGIPMAEGLMKNRYIGRTFIMPSQDIRQKYILLKTNPIKSIVNGKRIVLVDDSIVAYGLSAEKSYFVSAMDNYSADFYAIMFFIMRRKA